MPLRLGESGEALANAMGCPPEPPSEGMVETVTVTRHTDNGPRVGSFAEPAVGPVWSGHIHTSLSGKVYRPETPMKGAGRWAVSGRIPRVADN